jgi:UDPglucose 6-dehydrogenase
MNIGVIGGGVVGRATAKTYSGWDGVRKVCIYDTVPERATHLLADALEGDVVFVCLPTPGPSSGEVGPLDISAVRHFFELVTSLGAGGRTFVIKSTLPIGASRRLTDDYQLSHLLHAPEFLTARTAEMDSLLPSRNLLGIPTRNLFREVANDTPSYRAAVKITDLYHRRFPGVTTHLMTSDETEAVKLFVNAFFAVKIATFNEIRALVDKLDLNWERILTGILSDGRIAHSHTQVPGPDGYFGFGGACLPKDLANLAYQIKENGLSANVVEGAIRRNTGDRGRTFLHRGER